MQLDISKKNAEWFAMGEGEDAPRFRVRPFPASRQNLIMKRDGGFEVSGKSQLEKFKYCLVEWKNVVDTNGTAILLTDEVKQSVFDNRLGGISDFVFAKLNEMEATAEEDEKN